MTVASSARPGQVVADSIAAYLRSRHHDTEPATRLLARLGEPGVRAPDVVPAGTIPHAGALADVLAHIASSTDELLAAVGTAIAAGGGLSWRVDDGSYYVPGAPVGEAYRDGNMHAVLLEDEDFAMGLFLLGPNVDYLDHQHAAAEFYLNLTGPTWWRFDHGEWREQAAGTVLWNEPWSVHATRTSADPWLACWAWLGDIDQPCEVVPRP